MLNSGTSVSSLIEQVRAKTEQNRQAIEHITQEQFSILSKNLQQSSTNALHTTEIAILDKLGKLENHITSYSRVLHRAFGWTCLRGFLLSLSILIGVGLGSWSTLIFATKHTATLAQEIAFLTKQKELLSQQNAHIWNTFKGMTPYHANGKDYIITQEGWQIRYVGTLQNNNAWELVRK